MAFAALVATCAACGGERAGDSPRDVSGPPPPIEVRSALEPATGTIGDRFTYVVELERDPGVEAQLPPLVDSPGDGARDPSGASSGAASGDASGRLPTEERLAGVPVLERRQRLDELPGGRLLQRVELVLRPTRVGTWELPAVVAEVGEDVGQEAAAAARSEARRLEVTSVLPTDVAELDIRDVKPVRELRDPWWWRAVLLAAAGALLLIAVLRVARRRRLEEARAASEERQMSAHEWAFARLEELRRSEFVDLDELRTYYFSLSGVLREYIERRFVVNATDLTSEEILARVRTLNLGSALQRRLAAFLSETDRVKYAAQVPARSEIEQTWEAAVGFVESTLPQVGAAADASQPEAEGPAAANGGSSRLSPPDEPGGSPSAARGEGEHSSR